MPISGPYLQWSFIYMCILFTSHCEKYLSKKRHNSVKNLWNRLQCKSGHTCFIVKQNGKYQDPNSSGSLDIFLLTKLSQKRKKGIIQSKIYGIESDVNYVILALQQTVCQYVRIQAQCFFRYISFTKLILTKVPKSKKGHNSVKYLWNWLKGSGHPYFMIKQYAKYHNLAQEVLQIFCSQA